MSLGLVCSSFPCCAVAIAFALLRCSVRHPLPATFGPLVFISKNTLDFGDIFSQHALWTQQMVVKIMRALSFAQSWARGGSEERPGALYRASPLSTGTPSHRRRSVHAPTPRGLSDEVLFFGCDRLLLMCLDVWFLFSRHCHRHLVTKSDVCELPCLCRSSPESWSPQCAMSPSSLW